MYKYLFMTLIAGHTFCSHNIY